MNYQIALDPRLDLSSAEFAAAWNQTPKCRAAGTAHETTAVSKGFDPALATAIATVISGAMAGIATSIFYDLIKEALTRRGVTKQTEIIEMTQPDGTRLVVVRISEDGGKLR